MKKNFVGLTTVVKGETVSTDILLELMNTKTPVDIEEIMHKEMSNLSMDVADSSSDQSIWKNNVSMGSGIDAVMHYLVSGPMETVSDVYIYSEDEEVAVQTAKALQGIYDAELPAYLVKRSMMVSEDVVNNQFKEEEVVKVNQSSKQEMAKNFWKENSGAVVGAVRSSKKSTKNNEKKDDVKMRMPKMKASVAVEERPETKVEGTKVKSGMPGLKPGVAHKESKPSEKPAPKKTGNKSNWYTNPQYYPVLGRFNEIIDNIKHGRMVDSALGIEELVIVKTEDIERYAKRTNAKDYLFIIQIKTSGVVFDFPIKKSDAYSNAELYSESISFSRDSGKLRPVFTFTHPNSVQVMARCTCGHTFRGNTSFLYCSKCKTNHGAAEVTFSHPTLELTNGHQFARTTPTNVHIHPDTLALVMAIAQLKNGGDMNGVYSK